MKNNWICTDPGNLQFVNENFTNEFEFREYRLKDEIPEYIQNIVDKFKSDVSKHIWILTSLNEPDKVGKLSQIDLLLQCMDCYTGTIDIDDYSLKDMKEAISAYYSSLDEVIEKYGYDSEKIIAECIFEQKTGLY
jgi:hypothetical protein